MEKKLQKCMLCTEKCPQAALAKEIAEGRMYATKELIRLQKELEGYKQLEEQGLPTNNPNDICGETMHYIVCETVLGKYAVRPINWCGIWDEHGKILDSINHTGVFDEKKEAEWYAGVKNAEVNNTLLMLPKRVGDKVYAYNDCFGVLEYEVDCIIIEDNGITYQCSAYSMPIGDCPSECLDEIEPDITDFGKTVFCKRENAIAMHYDEG